MSTPMQRVTVRSIRLGMVNRSGMPGLEVVASRWEGAPADGLWPVAATDHPLAGTFLYRDDVVRVVEGLVAQYEQMDGDQPTLAGYAKTVEALQNLAAYFATEGV